MGCSGDVLTVKECMLQYLAIFLDINLVNKVRLYTFETFITLTTERVV